MVEKISEKPKYLMDRWRLMNGRMGICEWINE